jgi:hypothetical protein
LHVAAEQVDNIGRLSHAFFDVKIRSASHDWGELRV